MRSKQGVKAGVAAAVLLASLGYFVDIYDLILFSIVRVKSLQGLGFSGEALLSNGVRLLNMQMAGMLIGGILWGVLGDKKGRLSVLFGSIGLYSVANIANGFVSSINGYAAMRFVAGLGLAGELGAGITLVTELMPTETRGYGTMIVAGVGVFGGVIAGLVGDRFDWRVAYWIGGGLGLLLLILRIGVFESGMFESIKGSAVARGDFRTLFASRERVTRYVCSILIGTPIWYVIGILATYSPEFGRALGMPQPPNPAYSVLFLYLGTSTGGFLSGALSQLFKTRRKVAFVFVLATAALTAAYLTAHGASTAYHYALCLMLGIATGYWAVFVTMASEQFGTNIRATVTTTVPNFVRGSLVPISLAFQAAKAKWGILGGAGGVGAVTVALALVSLTQLRETYGKDLNYCEE